MIKVIRKIYESLNTEDFYHRGHEEDGGEIPGSALNLCVLRVLCG